MRRTKRDDVQKSPREFLEKYPETLRNTAERLRELVRSAFPDALEKVYGGWKLIGYRLPDGRGGRYFCCIVPQRKEMDVLLGFQYGIAMRDPKKLMEGKGTQVRFVRMRRRDDHQDEDLIWLIEEAARAAIGLRHL